MVTKEDEFESEDTNETKPSNRQGSFTLDFFDSDELEKTDLKRNSLVSQVKYITHVSISLPRNWLWTKPCKTPLASLMAAENMVCARLLWETGFVPVSDLGPEATNGWSHDVRSHYSWIHEGSHMFVGETREILVPEGMSPRRFRKNFHKLQFNSGSDDEHIGVTTSGISREGHDQ